MLKETYVATTLFGLEEILAGELAEIGVEDIKVLRRAVSFKATNAQLYKVNLSLHTALRVLKTIRYFRANSEKELYDKIYNIAWTDYFTVKKSFAVTSSVSSDIFNHSHYVALKTKDAIVDKFRNKTNLRPSVDIKNPDISINIHISGNSVDVSMDSSGIPLFKRGYRKGMYTAPLNEVLAAGLLKLAGWKGDTDFYDPMCGSGTIAIEAALIAKGIPPGVFRDSFAFMNWNDFDEELYRRVFEGILTGKDFNHKIYASDVSADAVKMARDNVKNAKLDDLINISVTDIGDVCPHENKGFLLINPPYGERIREDNITELYQQIGNSFKRNFTGFDAWVFSANINALKYIGLKPSKKIDLRNAKLKCKLCQYEIFEGKRKDFLEKTN